MLLSCIAKWNETNVGKFLIDFLYYFGFYYDYQYEMNTAVGLMQGRLEQLNNIDPYVMTLHIYDPLNNSNNVGTILPTQASTSRHRSCSECSGQPTSPSTSTPPTAAALRSCSRPNASSPEGTPVILRAVCGDR